MSLPTTVDDYLKQHFSQLRQPFCIELDGENRFIGSWGDGSVFGLDMLAEKSDITEVVPGLLGSLDGESVVIPMMNFGADSAADVHVLNASNQTYVMFFDRSADLKTTQSRQQARNELGLLNRQQKKLLQRQRHLISELVTAKAELESQRRTLQENNARTSEFLAMMSHDFRTPLTSIVGYVEQLEQPDVSDATVKESVQAISRGSRHILSLVENVIDKARLDTGEFHIQATVVDLRDLLADVAAIMAPLAAEKELGFSASVAKSIPESLVLDPGGVRQVLINLIGNAVKFTDRGSVAVSVTDNDETLVMKIQDTGSGIKEKDQERIFAAFQRADRSVVGSGLGLSITQQLTRLMGGNLALKSEERRGTTVTVTLPLKRPIDGQVATSQTTVPSVPQSRTARILMVEDNADIRRLVELALTRGGHSLMIAADGLEAIHMAVGQNPELILMDLNLPNLDGRDAAKQIRELGFVGKILAFSARRDLDESNCKPEFDGVIHKPIRMAQLLATVDQHLS